MTPGETPPPAEESEERARGGKGFKARKREDHALVVIRELLTSLGNPSQARRLLLELGRYYDPILGGAIMEVGHKRAIMEAIEAGRTGEAEALIQARYALYIKDRAHLGRSEDG
jgi:hypothetical protein